MTNSPTNLENAERAEKPELIENRREWIWYCESTSGVPVVTFGRWPKYPQQLRYKLADIQPTEHDHPVPSRQNTAARSSLRLEGEVKVKLCPSCGNADGHRVGCPAIRAVFSTRCEACDGEGRIYRQQFGSSHPDDEVDNGKCEECNGNGSITEARPAPSEVSK